MKEGKNSLFLYPWKVGEILLSGISKIDEYASYFNQFNLNFVE
jgi:hypothetical protein